MSQLQNFRLTYDVSDAEKAARIVEASLKSQQNAMQNFIVKSVQFNAAGQAQTAVIEQIDAQGRKVVTTLNLVGQQADRMAAQVVQSTQALAQMRQAAALASTQQVVIDAKKIFPVPDNASIASLAAYSNAIQRLQLVASQTGVSMQQVQQMMFQAAASPREFAKSINTLPPEAQKAAQAVLALAKAADAAGRSGVAAGQSFFISFRAAARAVELLLLRQAINSIRQAFVQGILEASRYQVQLQQVANVSGQTGLAFEQLASQVRVVSEQLAVPLGEVATAAQQALTSQLGNAAQGFQVLNASAQLSLATGTNLAQTTQLLTTSLQSYGLQSTQAAQAANALFLAAQRTSTPLNELTSVIGRAGITARALGLDFEQVVSVFLTLSQQGRRPAEAFSLIEQIFNRLLNPTEQLQNVLNSMGTPTAELAVQVYGLSGVLNRLSEIAEQTPERLGEITGSLRSLKSILGLTGDEIINLETNLAAFGGSLNALSDAAQAVAQTPAQQIRAEFQRISNVFTEDFGRTAITAVVRLVEALGGVQSIVNGVRGGIVILVGAFAAYKTVTLLSAASTAIFGARITATGIQTVTFTGALARAKAGLISFVAAAAANPAVLATIFTVALLAMQEYTRSLAEARRQTFEELNREIQQESQRTIESIQQQGQQAASAARTQITNIFRPLVQAAAHNVQLAQNARDLAINNHAAVLDSFRLQSQEFLNSIRSNINELRSRAREIENDIQTAQRRIQSFSEQSARRLFDMAVGSTEDPQQALTLIQQRREQLENEIRTLFERGDRQSIESARDRMQELSQLIAQEQSANISIQRAQFDQLVAAGQVTPTINPQTGQLQYRFQVNMNNAIEQTNALRQLETQLEQQLIALREEELAQVEAQQAAEETRLATLEQRFESLSEFSAFTSSGQLESRFRQIELTQGRAAALQAVRTEFNQLADQSLAAVGGNFQQRAQFMMIIAQLRANLEAQLTAQEQVNQANLHTQQLQNNQQNFAQQMQQAQALRTASEAAIEENRSDAAQAINNIQGVLSASNLENFWGTFFTGAVFTPHTQVLINQARAAANALNDALQDVAADPTQINQALASGALQDFRNRLQALADFSGVTVSNVLSLQTASGTSVGANLNAVEDALNSIGTHSDNLNEANDSIASINQSLQGLGIAAQNLPQGLGAATVGANTNSAQMANNFHQAEQNVIQTISAINQLRAAIQQVPPLPLGPVAPAPAPAPAPGFAEGGIIASGPSGVDQILARVTRGEFIVNPDSTRRFYTQLVDINAGRMPRFAEGGLVSTSVGDITINLPSGTAETNVREFAHRLRREIKRGTIPGFDR